MINIIKQAIDIFNEGRVLEAREILDKNFSTSKESSDAWLLKGLIESSQNNYNEAIKSFKKGLSITNNHSEIYNALGIAYYNIKNNEQALLSFKKSIKFNEKNLLPYKNLGILYYTLNKYDYSIEYLKKVLDKSDTIDKDLILLISNSYMKTNDIESAINYLKKGIEIYENDIRLLTEIASLYFKNKDYKNSINFYSRTTEIAPNYAIGFNGIGMVYSEINNTRDALINFDKALKVDPNFFDSLVNIGNCLQKIEAYEEAIDFYERALKINNNNPELLSNIGILYLKNDNGNLAIKKFNEALKIDPNNIRIIHNKATAYQQLGNMLKAKKLYREAINLELNYGDSLLALSYTEKLKINDPAITKAERNLKNLKILENKSSILFALSKVFSDNKNYKKASKYLIQANKDYRKTISFSNQTTDKIIKIMSEFNEINPNLTKNTSDPCPIFIVGLPRSGSTLLEQILSNHKDIFGAGELTFMPKAIELSGLMENIINKKPNQKTSQDQWDQIYSFYNEKIKKINIEKKPFITDKLPGNFIYTHIILNTIHNAKIIHISRNKNDNCLSLFQTKFIGLHQYAYNIEEIKFYYRKYNDMMKLWNKKYPEKIFNISYEDIINNSDESISELLKWLSLSYSKEMKEIENNQRIVKTASNVNVRKPIFDNSINKWKNYEDFIPDLFTEIY